MFWGLESRGCDFFAAWTIRHTRFPKRTAAGTPTSQSFGRSALLVLGGVGLGVRVLSGSLTTGRLKQAKNLRPVLGSFQVIDVAA